jgi:hypothetical protein
VIRWTLIATLALGGPAWGSEYRNITLSNGRVVPAEIKSITANEMVLQTPQGTLIISPETLKDMAPLTTEAYMALRPWRVLVLPFGGDEQASEDQNLAHLFALRVLASIDAVSPARVADLDASVGESTRSALASCGTDLQCATRHGETAKADVVVMGQVGVNPDKRVLTLGAIFVDAPAARRRVEVPYTDTLVNHRKAITDALYDTLFLTPPAGASVPKLPVVATAPAPRQKGETNLATLAWAPVPGLTALKQDNTVGFATALGVVGAGTAATVYMTGAATYSAPQLIAVSTLSSYGLTVLVNHLFLD